MIIPIILFSIWSIVLFLLIIASDSYDTTHLYLPSIIGTLVFCVFLFSQKHNTTKGIRNWGLRPTYICFLGLIIVNLQFFFDYAIGLSDLPSPLSTFGDYKDICLYGSLLFINIFTFTNFATNRSFESNKIVSVKTNYKIWELLYVAVFCVFILTINIQQFLSGEIYWGSGASDYNWDISNSAETILKTIGVILITLYTKRISEKGTPNISIKSYCKSIPFLFWIPFLLYTGLRLVSGDRGPVLYNILLVFYSYVLVSHKYLKIKIAIPLLLLGAFAVTLLGVIRSRDTNLSYIEKIEQSLIRQEEMDATSARTISPFTRELAGSVQCNYIAVRDIESGTPYTYGKYTLLQVLTSFPGSKRSYFEPFGLTEDDFSSATYITKSFNGSNYYTYGIGTAAFAEAYLEGGLLGVIITAIILGWLFKKIDLSFGKNCRVSRLNICALFTILIFSYNAIYISRSSISLTLGSLIYTIIFYSILNFFIKRFRKAK